MSRLLTVLLIAALTTGVLGVTGCGTTEPEPEPVPTIAPPLIGTEGVLKAGIDLGTPPWAGEDDGRRVGIDIDVAEALAARLGLELEIVDMTPDGAAEALESGRVDVVLSVPFTEDYLGQVMTAGTYLTTGPAFFISSEETGTVAETLTLETIGARTPAAQEESLAYWRLEAEFGEGWTIGYPALREAFEALEAGEIEVVAGDAVIGAYMARDFDTIRFAGQLGAGFPVGIVVAAQAGDLADAVREALDALAADGILDTVRTKWVGDLPVLAISRDGAEDMEEGQMDGANDAE